MSETAGSLPKVCVILGAGASNDVADAVTEKNAQYKPPLTRDLFDTLKNPAYYEVMRRYSGAGFLYDNLSTRMKAAGFNLEETLLGYAKHRDKSTREKFKHIPAYLRDLIYLASKEYTYSPSSYNQLVHELLAEYQHDVLFITLNYDNLLEQALLRSKREKFQFVDMANYVASNREAKVIKLHGSINWFRNLPGGTAVDWESAVKDLDIFQPVPEGSIIVQDEVGILRDFDYQGNRLYPILTAPLAGKDVADVVCPDSHRTIAKKFMSECNKYLIIGTSGLDKDLLTLLDDAIPPKSSPLVHIVDPDVVNVYSNFEEGVRAFRHTRLPPSASRRKIGFRQYLSEKAFKGFLESS